MSELPSERASKVVKERGKQYGPPTPIYLDWAEFMNTWLDGRPLTASDGAISNIFLKLARLKHGEDNPDHTTDICGYANVYEMIEEGLAHESS